jgi:hemerythrin-like domain-containing protein
MKRAPELAPLSHDHHHALDVARRLRRASDSDLDEVLAYLRSFWASTGAAHFALEEQVFTVALCDDERWPGGVARMLAEHAEIRARADAVSDVEGAHALGELLHDHVRFEERELFAIAELSGDALEHALQLAGDRLEAAEAG